MKIKTPKELEEIKHIYDQMGACVKLDKYGEIITVKYR